MARDKWGAVLQKAGLLMLVCSCGPALAADKPNIIFILTDDQGVESIEGPSWSNEMGCYTPVLRRLAEQGVSFTNCRVNPNCSPTRAALMTGRYGLDTGVNGVISRRQGDDVCNSEPLPPAVAWATDRLSLQTQERTIAEVLHDEGYYTILVDKWHCGYDLYESRGLLPQQQGFDEFFDWVDTLCEDDPERIGDEHILRAAQQAQQAVARRGNRPYALFFHTHSPHRLAADSQGMLWWRVDPALTPQSAALPTNSVNRFIQNVEAMDTVLGRMLSESGLGVIDAQSGTYVPSSNAVVFFLSDNGTDPLVTTFRHGGEPAAKNTLYEGGIKVPLFVMGRQISTDPALAGTEDLSQVSAVDFFNTLCDVVGVAERDRDNPLGTFPRRSMSFADCIGWPPTGELPRREYTMCSLGLSDGNPQGPWTLALIGDRYKLICPSGGIGFDTARNDEFYDLQEDPGETTNLLDGVMALEEIAIYAQMRERAIDQWPAAVGVAEAALIRHYTIEERSTDGRFLLVGHVVEGELDPALEEFYDLALSSPGGRRRNLAGGQMRPDQRAAYLLLAAQLLDRFASGVASPDLQAIEWPVADILVMSDRRGVENGAMTVGFADVGGPAETEYRSRLIFDLPTEPSLPGGFTNEDIVGARIIFGFKNDSQPWRESGYSERDTETGLITIHRMRSATTDLWNPSHFDASVMGSVDLPPHIIPDPPAAVRGVSLPVGARVACESEAILRDAVLDWIENPGTNFGIMVRAERLAGLTGDQQVQFLRDARMRVILDRRR